MVGCSLLVASAADACPWDYETLRAETTSLPCVGSVALGVFPQHTPEYLTQRIAAADAALAWAPGWLEALDSKAIALLRLKRYPECLAVLELRQKLAPDDYATHANLGTLFTFTGELERALTHIDKALAIEPKAHLGRERYHRQLVEYLLKRKSGAAVTGDALGLTLTSDQRLKGSPEVAKAAGVSDDALDALVSMIAVYGAADVPFLYEALGNVAALKGQRRVAWAAYTRAVALKHPARAELVKWTVELERVIKNEYRPDPKYGDIFSGMATSMAKEESAAKLQVEAYARFETAMLKAGLPFWSGEGVEVLYWKQEQLGLRCELRSADAARPGTEVKPAAADAYLTALQGAALVARGEPAGCRLLSAITLEYALAHAAELRAPEGAQRAEALREPLGMLTAAAMRCPKEFEALRPQLSRITGR